MIWIRRLIAVVLGILMIPLLVFTLLSLRVNATFLDEQFYKDQLVEADIYNFLYSDALTVAIDQGIEEAGGLPLGVNLTTAEIVAGIQTTLPPDWIQREVELAIDDALPYLTGKTDTLSLSVDLAGRADVALLVIRDLVSGIDLHAALFDETIPQAIEDELGTEVDIALGVTLTAEEVSAALARVITPSLMQSLQSQAVDELGPYLIGRSDTFTFTIPLSDQVDAAQQEFNRILERVDLQPYILDEVLEPALDEFIVNGVELPLGVIITREEIRQAMEEALTPAWVDQQTDSLVNGIVPYLTGQTDEFTVSVPVRDRISAAVEILTTTVDQKYAALLASLPPCTSSQIVAIALGNADPATLLCTVPGLTIESLKSALGVDPLTFLGQSITDQLPSTVLFTEQDLLATISGTEAGEVLEDVRMTIRNGWSFDEIDLREVLTVQDPDSLETLDNIRETIRDGWDWTEDDLLELVYDADSLNYSQDRDDFDDIRGYINRAQSWTLALPLMSLVLLGIIGFTGGRKWITKLGWAAGALFISAAVVLVVSGPLYDSFAKDQLEEWRADRLIGTDSPRDELLINKGFDTGIQIGDAFLSGIQSRALLLLLVGGVAMGGSVVFSFIGGGPSHIRKPGKESMLPPEPQSVGDMLREAEENLGEGEDSPFPDAPATQDDESPSEDDKTSENKDEENK